MEMCRGVKGLLMGLAFLLPVSLLAATPVSNASPGLQETVRGTVDPARSGEAVALPPVGENMLSPAMEVKSSPEYRLPKEAAQLKFKLKGLDVVDSCIFSSDELVEPFLQYFDQTITLEKLEEIANQITLRHQKEGYVLTHVIIPPQRIHNGMVTLKVVSGYINSVEVVGDIKPGMKALIEDYGQKIQDCIPLTNTVLERYLLLANDIPGIKVQSIMTPSKKKPGTVDLKLVVEQQLDAAYIATNNYGTRYQGPQQYLVGIEENSKFNIADSTQYQYVTTANKELNSGQIRHSELLACDIRFNVFGQALKSKPQYTLAPLRIVGDYNALGMDAALPVIRSRRKNLTLRAGFTALTSKSHILGQLFYNDRIRPVFGSILFNFRDSIKGFNSTELTCTEGLHLFGSSGKTSISRPNGKSRFTKLNMTVSRLQPLPWHFSFFALATGQYAFQPLLSAVQFGFGGNVLGRGYDPSEIVGDRGIAGTLELRYHYKPELACAKILTNMHIYSFYDMGRISNIYKLATIRQASIESTGVGVRLAFVHNIDTNFYIAKPLTRVVSVTQNRHPRFFFSLAMNFLP